MMKLTFQISGLAEISTVKPAPACQLFLLISARAYEEKLVFFLCGETHLLEEESAAYFKIPISSF